MIAGLKVNTESSIYQVYNSPTITTALSPFIGYHKAETLAKEMKISKTDIYTANKKLQVINPEKLQKLLEPQNLLKLGFSIKDLE